METFLIIDDDADDIEFFCEALQDVFPDCVCYTAPNGQSGMKLLEDGEIAIPDLIFLDLNMPLMNGWQFLGKLKSLPAYKSIPVIINSTSSYHEDIRKGKELGAVCFFIKPSTFGELKSNLSLVAKHAKENTLNMLVNISPFFV